MPEHQMHEVQRKALGDLDSRMRRAVERLQSLNKIDESILRITEFSNVFAVVGPRGAGKSTVLIEAYRSKQRLRQDDRGSEHAQDADRLAQLCYLPPIDCSMTPSSAPLGTVILSHLYEHALNSGCGSTRFVNGGRNSEIKQELIRCASLCARSDEGYKELCLELSSSPSDYTTYLQKGIEDRLQLWGRIRENLKGLVGEIPYDGLAVILDDFDLVPDAQARRWLFSLLDELRQPLLSVILAADYGRLQHLVFDPETGFDDMTGRALLQKIIPPQHVVSLGPWPYPDRLEFIPFERRQLQKGSPREDSNPADNDAPLNEDERQLKNLVLEAIRHNPVTGLLVLSLLPSWPRGLNNLYASLDQTQSSSDNLHPEPERILKVLGLVAIARGEPLLSRDLESQDIDQWFQSLRFPRTRDSAQDWQESVGAALQRSRGASEHRLRPMHGLRPIPLDRLWRPYRREMRECPDTWLDWSEDPTTTPLSEEQLIEEPFSRGPLSHDPKWRDPHRHDNLWRRPMRDAEPAAQPLWVEVLLDQAFRSSGDPTSSEGKAARRRVEITRRWWPLRTRLERAAIRSSLSTAAVRELFAEWEGKEVRPALLWVDLAAQGEIEASIGWRPLLDALRGARDPLLIEQRNVLLISNDLLKGKIPLQSSEEALALLPDQLWAMVLLADALDRCPWTAFSGPLGLQLRTYILLAGALVRTAYLFAMQQVNALGHALGGTRLSEDQEMLLRALAERDPSELLQKDRNEPDGLLALLTGLLCDDLQLTETGGSLNRAARSFLDSRAYTALKILAAEYTV